MKTEVGMLNPRLVPVNTCTNIVTPLLGLFPTPSSTNNRQISTSEIKDALKDLGIRMTQLELQELLEFVDDDGSGELDLEEFRGAVDHLGADVSEAALRKTRAIVACSMFTFLTVVGMFVFGSVEFDSNDFPWLDGIYFCIITLTSIGFGGESSTCVYFSIHTSIPHHSPITNLEQT